jgi:hypothetical protein
MDDFEKNPDFQSSQSNGPSSTAIAIIVAALVVVVGAFLYFGSASTNTDQKVTQNNMPAPAIEQPAPVTPPATAEPPAAEPATPPITPPGNAPATNP